MILENEMGDSQIDKERTEKFPFHNGKKAYLSREERT